MTLIQIKLINGEPIGRPCNPYPEYFLTDSESGLKQIHNTHHVQFEQSVTYHPAPGCSESDGVEGELVWQYYIRGNASRWADVRHPDLFRDFEHFSEWAKGNKTRQIWRLSPSQKVEVKEVGMVSKEAVLKILERNRINFARLKTHSGDFGEHILYKIIEEIEALSPPTH